MDFNSLLPWMVGSTTAIIAFWGQISHHFARFTSLFVVTIKVNTTKSSSIIAFYLIHNYRKVNFGNSTYDTWIDYVKPRKKNMQVAYKSFDHSKSTFLGKNFPLFLDSGKDSTSLSFIRGTVNPDAFMIAATEFYNNFVSIAQDGYSLGRFCTRRVQGSFVKRFNHSGSQGLEQRESSIKEPHVESKLAMTPLGWKLEELGQEKEKSPFSFYKYSQEVYSLKTEIERWYKSKDWFMSRHVPWRLGALAYGGAGNGKTSFIRSIAQELDMPILIFDLSTMTNSDLVAEWKNALERTPCIILFEDIDRMFDENRVLISESGLTLDCLLNLMSGAEPSDGILVFMTANDVSRLDAALGVPVNGESTRPGRLDLTVEFKNPEADARLAIAEKILRDDPELQKTVVLETEGKSCAQVERACVVLAQKMFWKKDERLAGWNGLLPKGDKTDAPFGNHSLNQPVE